MKTLPYLSSHTPQGSNVPELQHPHRDPGRTLKSVSQIRGTSSRHATQQARLSTGKGQHACPEAGFTQLSTKM
ncbi:unnamed protein product [Boreogadus saida]